MKHSELSETILKDCIKFIYNEHDLQLARYSEAQYKLMITQVEQFITHYMKDETLLIFFYTWYNKREVFCDQTLWKKYAKEANFSNEKSKQLLQMHKIWFSIENNALEFAKENQRVLESQKENEPEQDR